MTVRMHLAMAYTADMWYLCIRYVKKTILTVIVTDREPQNSTDA